MNNLTVKIDKEEFLKKSEGEQNWVLYEVAEGHEERITKLESRPWWNQGKSFLGGVLGGALVMIGKGTLWGG